MFAYNYMVTTIRAITQELDTFASEYSTALEHKYVDNRPLAEEIRDALQGVISRAMPVAESQFSPPLSQAQPPLVPPPIPQMEVEGFESAPA